MRNICAISSTTKWGTFRFFRFLCVRRMYHLANYQVEHFPVSLYAQHTYHALPTIVRLAQARPNDVRGKERPYSKQVDVFYTI